MNITEKRNRKAEYRQFLQSNFWQNLSATKRQQVGKCERCGSTKQLQAHHLFYRSDWYQTRPEDLQVLCRQCHELEHGIIPTQVIPNKKRTKKNRRRLQWLRKLANKRKQRQPKWMRQSFHYHPPKRRYQDYRPAHTWTGTLKTPVAIPK